MTIRGKWAVALLTVLLLSVAANLFLGGLFAGGALYQTRQPGPVRALAAFVESLPEAARPVVRDAFLERRAELRERFVAVAAARREVGRIMAEEDLDRARLDAAFGEVRARSVATQALLHEILAGAMAELPPEVRAQWQPRWRARGWLR